MRTLTRTLGSSGWTRRSVALALALAAVAGTLLASIPTATAGFIPPPCNKILAITSYYSDATKTTRVGTCVNDQCAGTFTCTGTKTSFIIFSGHRCSCDI